MADSGSTFDEACSAFTRACLSAAAWKHNYLGAAYMTRIENAFNDVTEAFKAVARADKSDTSP